MSIRKIVLYGHPTLRKNSEEIKEITPQIEKIIQDMRDTLEYSRGIGLSANQIGFDKRILLIATKHIEGMKDPDMVLINPVITVLDKKTKEEEEGCLSFPDVWAPVARNIKIHVESLDEKGKKQSFDANDLFARVILHEFDHINGIVFIDHFDSEGQKKNEAKLKKIMKKAMKLYKDQVKW